jgi:hypothetical protein
LHEIYTPFGKGVDDDNGMKWSWVGTSFLLKDLTGWEFFNDLNVIFEYGRPKITSMQFVLGCIHPRKMTTTSSEVIVI